MKNLSKLFLVASIATAALSSCQVDTADRNKYDASTAPTPGVKTQAETDELAPRIDLPPDSTSTMQAADTTM
ncbi:hypothetical protein [Hymenobacter sp. 5414T-23]|uniref:hypothetical protein n=1 Tax=Hymenobacter sp. 5414T-23 TaxID=2932252 RepID=UPI001FD24C42|nr:hypothetical protein [Hymenobacter sp. 5414T-23]UOQ80095.1 hypothetical protein MUN83_14785 [Hymenobacter sp. 5414T-23]